MSELDAFAAAMSEVLDRCVWSQRETHASLVPYLIEESYELVEAIETGTRDDLLEELGDVLWQVMFHSEIARRTPEEAFDIEDVAANVRAKMVRRHPHVFGDEVAETPEDVVRLWTAAKKAEKHERRSVLDGIPPALPALALADKVLSRAASVGVTVPAAEAAAASGATGPAATDDDGSVDPAAGPAPSSSPRVPDAVAPLSEAELGERLLALVAAARANGLDAERALRSRIRALAADVRAAEQRPAG